MKILSVIVAAFSVLAFLVWRNTQDVVVQSLAMSTAALAVTTWLSPRISTYLRIFATSFAVETVIFGLCAFIARGGWWPQALSSVQVPDTLPLSLSIFGLLAFALSFVPVVGSAMHKADPYFEATEASDYRLPGLPTVIVRERWLGIGFIVLLILINQFQVYIGLVLSFFSRDMYNSLQDKNGVEFWRLLWQVFLVWAAIWVMFGILEIGIKNFFVLRWRRWLTQHMIGDWLSRNTHYQMTLTGETADNPDQRIAEDVKEFIGGTGASGSGVYDFSIALTSQLSSLVTFSILLWTLSANFTFPGSGFVIPGLLFWVALFYALFGTVVTHLIGRPLIRLSFEQQKYEANFRFSMARIREYSEQISLLDGELTERAALQNKFAAIYTNFVALIKRNMKLTTIVASYAQINVVVPIVVSAPFYFLGQITLGVLMQIAGAFGRVDTALSFFISNYGSLAVFKSVLDRLTGFDRAADRVRMIAAAPAVLQVRPAPTRDVCFRNLRLLLPNGRQIVGLEALDLKYGEATLITGPSGSGKSTLFRAIAGIWPYGEGVIETPEGARLMLLPQRPYIPLGTLRAGLVYPRMNACSDEDCRAVLQRVRLEYLTPDLDREDSWQQRLSGGEQQRLAIARAILAKPDWLFLDEATASLDLSLEVEMYAALRATLPQVTIISIGHRSTLAVLHDRQLAMTPDPVGIFTLR